MLAEEFLSLIVRHECAYKIFNGFIRANTSDQNPYMMMIGFDYLVSHFSLERERELMFFLGARELYHQKKRSSLRGIVIGIKDVI